MQSEPVKGELRDLLSQFPKGMSLELKEFEKGEFLLREGEPSDYVYILLSGSTRAIWSTPGIGQYVAIQSGNLTMIGDLAVFADNPVYSTSVSALEYTRTACMRKRVFKQWMEADKDLYIRLVTKNIQMLQRQQHGTRSTSMHHTEQRILEYLLWQYNTKVERLHDWSVINANREQIMDDIGGIGLRTLNRYISDFEKRGFLSIEKGKIRISIAQAKLIEKYLAEKYSV